ncbi:MAG: hypothetical protein AAFU56_02725 [Pseudomonadota bacterium]
MSLKSLIIAAALPAFLAVSLSSSPASAFGRLDNSVSGDQRTVVVEVKRKRSNECHKIIGTNRFKSYKWRHCFGAEYKRKLITYCSAVARKNGWKYNARTNKFKKPGIKKKAFCPIYGTG